MMKKTFLISITVILALFALNGCAQSDYNATPTYNSYDNRSYSDRQIDNVIATEMNSFSDKDIAQLNALK